MQSAGTQEQNVRRDQILTVQMRVLMWLGEGPGVKSTCQRHMQGHRSGVCAKLGPVGCVFEGGCAEKVTMGRPGGSTEAAVVLSGVPDPGVRGANRQAAKMGVVPGWVGTLS